MGTGDTITPMADTVVSFESKPLAEFLRPKTLDDVIGQEHLVGKDGILRKMLVNKFIPSMIFWGPPGCGKTTLAELISTLTDSVFISQSAVTTNLAQIRLVLVEAKKQLLEHQIRTVLFIDEIHRFNKAQQDALLPHVEQGTIIFIGATTENPSFEVIAPLLSRCRVFTLTRLSEEQLLSVMDRALTSIQRSIDDEGRKALLNMANGDARQLITILEISHKLSDSKHILTQKDIEEAAQKKMLLYDTKGDEHYNTISAYIKSLRASDTDAALYYLARMVKAGEDPLFIARRMVIFASEDIGMAQPTAGVVANMVFDSANKIGYPEAQIPLAFGTVYLSSAKKDRSAYDAFFAALHDVEAFGNLPIPLSILNAPTALMKSLDYGKGYERYSQESHLPEKLNKKKYYTHKE